MSEEVKKFSLAASLKELTELRKFNSSAPGIIISWLWDKQQFYASVAVFTGPFGQGREIISKVMNPDAAVACQQAMTQALEVLRERAVRESKSAGD